MIKEDIMSLYIEGEDNKNEDMPHGGLRFFNVSNPSNRLRSNIYSFHHQSYFWLILIICRLLVSST